MGDEVRMRGADHAARELEEQRRKYEQYDAMLAEVGSSESSDDDVVARPGMRRGTAPAMKAGGMGGARRGSDSGSERDGRRSSEAAGGGGGGAGPGAGAGAGAGAGGAAGRRDRWAESETDSDEDDEAAKRIESEFKASSAAGGAKDGAAAAAAGAGADKATVAAHMATTRPWLSRACRSGDAPVQCYVERDRGGMKKMKPLYKVYVEAESRFVCAAQKRLASKTSNFLISMDTNPGDRKNETIVGKLRSNAAGSAYILYDQGLAPDKAVTDSSLRKELGIVFFDYDKMGPGKMRAAVPRVNASGTAEMFRPREEEDGIEAAARRGDKTRLMFLDNKRPKWDESVGGHVLNFHGRVTKSSVKNFQMACEETGDDTVLQFGRIAGERFTMDFQWPISPLQGFAIVLASLDGKLADTKGYDAMKGIKMPTFGLGRKSSTAKK